MQSSITPLRLEITEAAQALRISRALLYRRIKEGRIHVVRDGGRVFVSYSELLRYSRSTTTPAAA